MNFIESVGPSGEEVCWTEKHGLWLNIVVKEEKEEEEVTAVTTVDGDAITRIEEKEQVQRKEEDIIVKLEEDDDGVFGVKEGEITVTLEEDSGGRPDSHSDKGKMPSEEPHPETPNAFRPHPCSDSSMVT
ncbi:hypothetical protein DPEC_G00168530 [Dallia pectoralis]|uniref:Uncharacterized protein n=1 Tax=Dallia pectoralis TaxID=75939 RepID=A0ACC2GCT8_DALPE|nr:hypothetical protein DPEC_G00168530 [Dallia pectoralis]